MLLLSCCCPEVKIKRKIIPRCCGERKAMSSPAGRLTAGAQSITGVLASARRPTAARSRAEPEAAGGARVQIRRGVTFFFVCVVLHGPAKGKGASQPPENSLQRPARGGGASTSTLDDVLTPQLVQSYLALQLHRAALDLTQDLSRGPDGGCPPQGSPLGPCRGPDTPLRRARRFTNNNKKGSPDVPVVSGFAGLGLPSAAPLVALHKNDEPNDVPVFRGNHEGTPLIHVVTPPPAAAARSAGPTTAPSVPVVKGSADPAHPTTPRVSSLLPGDLQLTPEEEEALAVLLEGRHGGKKPTPAPLPLRPRPTLRPALRPSPTRPPVPVATSVSGKVGGKAAPSQQPAPAGVQRHHPSAGQHGGASARDGSGNCCTQKRLLQELEKQLSILRQLNADHMREEWVRASYPSPYYPYLHNLPVHPARGYDAGPALLPTYFLPSSAGSRRRSPDPQPPWRSHAPEPQQQPDCDWSGRVAPGDAEGGSRLDDKVRFSEQQREADDLRGDDPQDDVGVDPKIGEPVDFEVR